MNLEAINTEINKLNEIKTYTSNKKTTILIYSNADHRAQSAAKLLYNMGYINTRYISTSYTSLLPGQ